MKRPVLWMGVVFLVLFAIIAALRSRNGDESIEAPPPVGAETIRSFWDAYHRATDARLAGDDLKAASAYRGALAIDPGHQDSLFYLATSLEGSGNYAEAANVLRRLTSVYPEHSRAWSQLGSVLATRAPGATPDLDGAEAAFSRSQEINSEHTGPFVRRGQLALERGDRDQARELFRIAADAGSPEAMFLAGLTAYLDDDLTTASKYFQAVLENSERESAITGRGASSEGDVQGELTALERARIRSSWWLYWTARRTGGYPDSVREAFRLAPVSPEATFEQVVDVDVEGRGAFVDLDRDGSADVVVATARGLQTPGGRIDVGKCWDVVPLDIDTDGWMDLYVIGSGYTGTGKNTLLRNERGQLVDVTDAWGLAGERPTARAVAADVDGDGDTDLLEVGNVSDDALPVRLYLQRAGRFELARRGLHYETHAVDAAIADVDADGRLDVFLLGWKAPGRLFRNGGDAFEDVTESAGLRSLGGDGYSAIFFDSDADGDPDLLVTAHAPLELSLSRSKNGPTPRLLRNDGRGHFLDDTSRVGLDESFGVMQAVAADVDADGFLDLVFAQGGLDAWHLEPSVVLRNREGRDFVAWALLPSPDEPRRAAGVTASGTDLFLAGVGIFRRSQP